MVETAFCPECQRVRKFAAEPVLLKDGARARQGSCPKCDLTLTRIVSPDGNVHRVRRFDFYFLGTKGFTCLDRAALFPMLGAFRWMIIEKPDGTFGWRDGFDHVLAVWDRAAGEMMKATHSTH